MTTHALVLRTVSADRKSHGGFEWPESGPVECQDWSPEVCCGNGLHGLLWGEGDGPLLDWSEDAHWLVVQVDASSIVDISGKVKFPRGIVVFSGPREKAVAYLRENGGEGRAIVGSTATAGDSGTIIMSWWDYKTDGRRVVIGGEDGIKAGRKYRCEAGRLGLPDGWTDFEPLETPLSQPKRISAWSD